MKEILTLLKTFKKIRLISMAVCFGLLFLIQAAVAQERTVVLFFIDGLELSTARLASAHGATNLKMMFEKGVVVEQTYCTSPAEKLELPDKATPWGTTTSPNVAAHTGCHTFMSRKIDDIFLAARDKNIKSVFAGGAKNYNVFTTPDFYYSGNLPDAEVVQKGIDHFKKDTTRLIRLHAQRIRDSWSGPNDRTDPNSRYLKSIVAADAELGRLIKVLRDSGDWDSTFLIVTSDHGMGDAAASNHRANVLSSWSPFMSFYGPGIKQGKTIPYAETPDLAIMAAHLLQLRRLKGHTDPDVAEILKRTTGTLLINIFEGASDSMAHPRHIQAYLNATTMKPTTLYKDYHNGILSILKTSTSVEKGVSALVPRRQTRSALTLQLLLNRRDQHVFVERTDGTLWALNGKILTPKGRNGVRHRYKK